MSILSVIKRWEFLVVVKENWKESLKLLSFTLVGGLLPAWGGFIVFKLFGKIPHLSNFTDHGEFAIYSAVLLAPSLYFILKDYKTSTFVYRHFFGFLCIVGLLVSALVYVGVTTASVGQIPIEVDIEFLRMVTWMLFILTASLSFFVTALDNGRAYIDVQRQRSQQAKELEKKFDELGGSR
jgi:hypothetical protein